MLRALDAFSLFEFKTSHAKFACQLIGYFAAVGADSFVEVIVRALERTHVRRGKFTGRTFSSSKVITPTLLAETRIHNLLARKTLLLSKVKPTAQLAEVLILSLATRLALTIKVVMVFTFFAADFIVSTAVLGRSARKEH